jgi:hypothetical protein
MKPTLVKPICGILCLHLFFCSPLKAQNAFVNDGASIYLESSASLYIQGNLENKTTGNFTNAGVIYTTGNLIHNSSVNLNAASTGIFRFNGTGNQVISGSNQPDFYNFTIDKSAGEIQLQTGISISNLLTFTSGSIFLNNQQVDLLTSGILTNETATNKIYDLTAGTGTVKIVQSLNAPSAVNPGNLGATITTTKNLGSTTIIRGHTAQFIVSASSVRRYYTITPATNTSLNATLRFNYFDNELNTQPEDELVQWHLPNGSAVWLKRGGTVNMSSNYVDLAVIDSFKTKQSLISYKVVALPLHLLEFKATKTATEKVLLNWRTEEEVNSRGFDIERSTNGVQWIKIGTVSSTGQRSTTQSYRFTDQSPAAGNNYYRLKQLDIDGQYDYSPVRLVSFGSSNIIQVYPTLAKENSQLFVGGISPEKVSIELFDNKGSVVYKTKLYSNSFMLPHLLPGVYYVKLVDINDHKVAGSTQILIY